VLPLAPAPNALSISAWLRIVILIHGVYVGKHGGGPHDPSLVGGTFTPRKFTVDPLEVAALFQLSAAVEMSFCNDGDGHDQ